MDFPIPAAGFEERNPILRVNILGGTRVILDGVVLKPKNRVYFLRDNAGREVRMKLKHRFLDPVPSVTIGMMHIVVAPRLEWYEYLWVSIPLLLVLAGGAIGGLLGAMSLYISTKIFRTSNNAVRNYLVSGLCSLGSVVLYFTIAGALKFFPSRMNKAA